MINQELTDKNFYKITNFGENDDSFQFQDGLNIWNSEFTEDIECGFSFVDIQNVGKFLSKGVYLRVIKVPITDPDFRYFIKNSMYYANRIIFCEKLCLNNVSTFEYLIKNGFDIDSSSDTIKWIIKNGHIEILKYLFQNNLLSNNKSHNIIEIAAEYGQLEIIKYIAANNIQLESDLRCAIELATFGGHLEVVKYLVNDGDHSINIDHIIKLATFGNHFELIKYLVENKSFFQNEPTDNALCIGIRVADCGIIHGSRKTMKIYDFQ